MPLIQKGFKAPVSKAILISIPIIMCMGYIHASGAERTYYSIHLQSFKDLENANKEVNAQRYQGKVVFWKKTEVPGKGEFYRVYLGRYENREDAVQFWEKLKESGSVSYFGIHEFKETFEPKEVKIVKIPPKPAPEKEETPGVSPLGGKEDRFLDNGDGTITDRVARLMWIKNGWRLEFFSATNWEDAKKKCEDFRYGGYSNWRLPTLDEWKSVVDPEKEYPALVEPNPFENIIVHMPYWSQTEFVAQSQDTGSVKGVPRAYTVMLYYGRMNHQSKNKRAFVLPVRSIE